MSQRINRHRAPQELLISVLQKCGDAWRKERPKRWWMAAADACDDVQECLILVRRAAR